MMITRRNVVAGAATLTAASLLRGRPAAAQATPVRIPLAAFAQDQAKLNALRRGVAAMKRRAPSDPTSWFFQAAVHGVTDEAVAQALCEDSAVANVDQERFWNRCPHFGQTSANFLIWHRAYLYYFERILRAASGQADFALPYWDYTIPTGRGFPAAFAAEFLDSPNDTWPNPLHHPERELAFVVGLIELSAAATNVTRIFNAATFFASNAGNSFAGNAETTDQGVIESTLHNWVHVACGGVIGSISGAMSDVPRAAFDAIFWVHHPMIDRLWVEWACRPGRQWGPLPSQEWLDEAPWAFHDADGAIKEEPRKSFFDHRALGYRYDIEDPDCAPLELPTAITVAAASVAPPAASVVLAEQPGTFAVAQAPFVQALDASQPPQSVTAAAAAGAVILEIVDVAIEGVPSSGYDVHVVAETTAGRDLSSASYIGSIALFGVGAHHGRARHSQTQRFDATAAMAALPSGSDPVVVIEPFDLRTPAAPSPQALTSGVAPPEARGRVTFSALRLVAGGQRQ